MGKTHTDEAAMNEAEMILKFHDLSMRDEGHFAAMGRISKAVVPHYINILTEEHDRKTDRADLMYGVVMMICGMCVSLFWGYSKAERQRTAEGIISVFSKRLRELAADEDFPVLKE